MQKFFQEIKEGNVVLTKEILEFDKKFFQKQLEKINKAY